MRLKLIAAALAVCASAAAFAPAHAADLITNGDFTAGDTGFITGYSYVAPVTNVLMPEGRFTIASNPSSFNKYWVPLSGNPMMLVNGAVSGHPVVWEENNITTPTTGTYDFSADVVDLCCNKSYHGTNNPSQVAFQVSMDGGKSWTTLAAYISNTHDAGMMNLLTGSFTALAGNSFDIRAIDGSHMASGNDFGLGSISVTAPPVPEPATWAMLIVGVAMIGFAARRRNEGSAVAA